MQKKIFLLVLFFFFFVLLLRFFIFSIPSDLRSFGENDPLEIADGAALDDGGSVYVTLENNKGETLRLFISRSLDQQWDNRSYPLYITYHEEEEREVIDARKKKKILGLVRRADLADEEFETVQRSFIFSLEQSIKREASLFYNLRIFIRDSLKSLFQGI